MQRLMKLSQYATHRKVSKSYISKLKAKGILIMRGALVDVAGSDAVLDDKPIPQSDQEPTTLAEAKRAVEITKAKRARLLFKKLEGSLVDVEEMKAATEGRFKQDAEAILNWPSRISGELAGELNVEEHLVYTVLSKHVRQFMLERSRGTNPSAAAGGTQ
jgi:hypothetical protein